MHFPPLSLWLAPLACLFLPLRPFWLQRLGPLALHKRIINVHVADSYSARPQAYYPFEAEKEILETYGDEIACRMFGLPSSLLVPECDADKDDTKYERTPASNGLAKKERWYGSLPRERLLFNFVLTLFAQAGATQTSDCTTMESTARRTSSRPRLSLRTVSRSNLAPARSTRLAICSARWPSSCNLTAATARMPSARRCRRSSPSTTRL